jgi:HAD superfamily hydrolase (TIGR01509 family)
MIEAVMWDNDGVLVDTETLFFETTRVAFSRLGLDLSREIWTSRYLSQGQSSREIALAMGADPDRVGQLLEERNQEYREVLTRPPTIRPHVRETLVALANDVHLALVTSSPGDQLELIHRTTDLLGFFQAIVTGDDVAVSKPHPEPYLRALTLLNLRAEECIAIEDSPRGLASAKAAGIACLIVPTELTRSLEFPGALAVEEDVARVLAYVRQPAKPNARIQGAAQ